MFIEVVQSDARFQPGPACEPSSPARTAPILPIHTFDAGSPRYRYRWVILADRTNALVLQVSGELKPVDHAR